MPPAGKRERREKGEGGGVVGMAGCTGRRWQRMEGVVVRIAMASCSVKTAGACGDISYAVTRLAGRCASPVAAREEGDALCGGGGGA